MQEDSTSFSVTMINLILIFLWILQIQIEKGQIKICLKQEDVSFV